MSAPVSRPIHPCVLNLTDGSRGAEFSTWAYITKPHCRNSLSLLPNLVTASASTITIYSVVGDEETASSSSSTKLKVEYTFGNIAGTFVFLDTLKALGDDEPDSLIVAFAGYPRLTVLQVTDSNLRAYSLLDLTTAVTDYSYGATTVLEQDAIITCLNTTPGHATVACILGGGITVAVVTLTFIKSFHGWIAEEPYILPLKHLSDSLPHHTVRDSNNNATTNMILNNQNLGGTNSITTGFGDVLSVSFISGYLEPVIVLLHTNPGGRIWCGRLGRQTINNGSTPNYVSALSVSVSHKRTALLWCREVPTDAFSVISSSIPSSARQNYYRNGTNSNNVGCFVLACSTITILETNGKIQQLIAMNGFAKAACPVSVMSLLEPNPLVKLSIDLHGSRFIQITANTAIIALRMGQLYTLQQTADKFIVLSIGQSLGSIGEIANLSSILLPEQEEDLETNRWYNKMMDISKNKTANTISMGLLFAGSRLGDSLLLGFALENISIPWDSNDNNVKSLLFKSENQMTNENGTLIMQEEENGQPFLETNPIMKSSNRVTDEVDHILRLEEEALYAPSGPSPDSPDIIPPSDEEDDDLKSENGNLHQPASSLAKRQRSVTFNAIRSLIPLDSLINLGPLGQSCEGPLGRVPDFLNEKVANASVVSTDPMYGATALVFPCGYAASGGIALVTVPGRDDRVIISEEDCLNVDYMWSLPINGIVLMSLSSRSGGGVRVMRLTSETTSNNSNDAYELSEIDLDTWCQSEGDGMNFFSNPRDVLSATLLAAGELSDGRFVLLICPEEHSPPYTIVIMKEIDNEVIVETLHEIDHADDSILLRVTPLVVNTCTSELLISFACLWSSGAATVVTLTTNGGMSSSVLVPKQTEIDAMELDNEDEEEIELRSFYADDTITAIDLFEAPIAFFQSSKRNQNEPYQISKQDEGDCEVGIDKKYDEFENHDMDSSGRNVASDSPHIKKEEIVDFSVFHGDLDEEDEELYGAESTVKRAKMSDRRYRETKLEVDTCENAMFLAVCRKSGDFEIYKLNRSSLELCWHAKGVGLGLVMLKPDKQMKDEVRKPRSHMITVQEIRFFASGLTKKKTENFFNHDLCIAVETSNMDVSIYKFILKDGPDSVPHFQRIPMKSVARPSQEQARHHTKLLRKGAISKEQSECDAMPVRFRFNSLFRFSGISGQDGLFAATSRPFWVIAERGQPYFIAHRTRHASPAGCKPKPICGFCSGVIGSGGYLTLHERVGRVGCQRLTLFRELSGIFDSDGLLPGGGYFVEKIPMGVTVRQIKFIDDECTSTGDHPLYAVLVSRELEVDQSSLNNDGLTKEERRQMEDDKETAKIKKQVEADLGGFDMESEWVEEIEREECFRVDSELGGAPPLGQSAYSLWIVDAANKWMVVDSYELGEHEYGIDLQVMMLTEFREEPGSSSATTITEEDSPKRLFITVGTGIVNHNGEDVSAKGRALLFEVKRHKPDSRSAMSQIAEISLFYEKEIFHGAVTTLSCLSCERKNRLVIGAGSDVNIEQLGSSGRLTQVGFFRATMQVLDISLFKNFFLLSDAYDSLYFLVWRESDKSLTLLAKDYDPIPVYAAGIMSRGAAMTFLCHDDRQNLQFFQYAPGEAAARGGNKLVCRADFHYGGQTTAFSSHYCRPSLLAHSASPKSTMASLKQQDAFFGRQEDDNRLGVHFGTTDGCMASVVPLSEPVYWRLLALQSVMSNALESDCALSRRSWRLYRRTPRRGGCRNSDRKKGVIDGDLILQYTDLPITEQEDIASAIGSTVTLILDNLLEIQCGSMIL